MTFTHAKERVVEIKARKDWKQGKSVIKGRSGGGQVIWRKSVGPRRERFLVRVGKDGSRQVEGTVQDALSALSALQGRLQTGTYQPADAKVRFDTFLTKHYLPWKRPSLKPSTFQLYTVTVGTIVVPALGRHRLNSLTTPLIQEWVDGLWKRGLAPKTVKEHFGQVRAALRWAMVLGLLKTNPAEGVVLGRRSEDWWFRPSEEVGTGDEDERGVDASRVWSAAEMQDFVRLAPRRNEMTRWVLLGLRTGLRPGEQCGLLWTDVDLEHGRVSVRRAVILVDEERRGQFGKWVLSDTKTGSRDVTLPEDAVRVLREQRAHVDRLLKSGRIGPDRARFVFPCTAGSRDFNNPSNIKDRLRMLVLGRSDRQSAKGIAGVRYVPPYGLRHTHATDLLRHKWSVWDVAKRLGTSVAMVERHYRHLLPDMEAEKVKHVTPLSVGS